MGNKLLILGCNGMLGSMVSLYFKEKGYNVTGFARRKSKIVDTIIGDVTNFELLKSIINDFDVIINCTGKLNKACDENISEAIIVNSYLPHFLAEITKETKIKIIHISTDCVFSGNKGRYLADDTKDATSIYGITKSLGELNDNKNLTLRTSIIGPDLNKNGIGLFKWYTSQMAPVNGFVSAFWTGLTTLELAKVIDISIKENLTGLYNVVPSMKISKYDLLLLIKKYFGGQPINPVETKTIDKSLVNSFPHELPNYEEMIKELKDWVLSHKIYEAI